MILGITAEGDDDENDKENLMRRREMIRSRLEKDPLMFGQGEEETRHRRGDIVSRWRDKTDASPVQYRVSIPSWYFSELMYGCSDCSRGLWLSLVFYYMLSSIVGHGGVVVLNTCLSKFWYIILVTQHIWLPLLSLICLFLF